MVKSQVRGHADLLLERQIAVIRRLCILPGQDGWSLEYRAGVAEVGAYYLYLNELGGPGRVDPDAVVAGVYLVAERPGEQPVLGCG